MWFSSLAVSALVLQNTFAGAASLGSLAAVEQPPSEVSAVEKRLNCRGGGNFLVYEFDNGMGGQSSLCLNGYVLATCVLFMSGAGGIVEALKNRVTGWITSKVEDASDAGPQVKARTETLGLEVDDQFFTWADLYAYQAVNGSLTYEAPADVLQTMSNTGAVTGGNAAAMVTAMELHEDGFSFTGVPLDTSGSGIDKRDDRCYRQIHVHYWANHGHSSTLLSSAKIGDLVYHGLNYAYSKDIARACYEMTNNGNWDGFLRVCFNHNVAQRGCMTCGGHSN